MPGRIAAAALSALVLAGFGSGLVSGRERETEHSAPADEIGRPLAEVAAGKRDPRTLRIDVEWRDGDSTASARLFGNGVGIWNDRVQIRLSPADVRSLAGALIASGYAAMPSRLGEEAEPLRIRGKILVSIAGGTKGVVQLDSGSQSEPLAKLASKILDLCRERSKAGLSASNLSDALARLGSGELAPETLRLIAQQRSEPPDTAAGGWLLELEGRRALARPFGPRGGYGRPKRLELSERDVRSLIALLLASDPATLPSNLYAPVYTEVRIQALHWSRDLLARRSLGVTPQTHGDRQKAFDRIVDRVRTLEQRVERKGREDEK